MIILFIQFAALWTLIISGQYANLPHWVTRYDLPRVMDIKKCTPAKHFDDYYYQPLNTSRTTPDGIAAYRSALTLDWMSAEDSRQRELVAAYEQSPQFPSPVTRSDCFNYPRPPAGSVAKLMLELLKNLEGDEGFLVAHLVQALVRAKLLLLESSMFENEPDLDALVKTPAAMVGEPHVTFPRIVEVLWMAVTDPSSVKKFGWCTVSKMTSFLQANRPIDIARHMRASEQIISRARFIMEEFIQHVTPLNMEKDTRIKAQAAKTARFQSPPPPLPRPAAFPRAEIVNKNKRPVRMQMRQEPKGTDMPLSEDNNTTTMETTEEQETIYIPEDYESKSVEKLYSGKMKMEAIEDPVMSLSSPRNHQITEWLLILILCLLL